MPSGTSNITYQISGYSLTRRVSLSADHFHVFGDAAAPITLPPANAIDGADFTNNADGSATATLADEHTLEDGKADLYWDGGIRYGCDVVVAGNSVTISGGAGDDLPASGTASTIANQVQINTPIDGDEVAMIAIGATRRAHLDLQDAGGATIKSLELQAGEPFGWDSQAATANPLSGDPIVRTMASNGSEAGPATLQILVLEDSTPDE
jgi:hypothetical protein